MDTVNQPSNFGELCEPDAKAVELFWEDARKRAGLTRLDVVLGTSQNALLTPPAWSLGWDADQADRLCEQVLGGQKTLTASALHEYEEQGEPLPQPGLSILCDGHGQPRALLQTDEVFTMSFAEVDLEQAQREGLETTEQWREAHARFLVDEAGNQLDPTQVTVIFETLKCVYPKPAKNS